MYLLGTPDPVAVLVKRVQEFLSVTSPQLKKNTNNIKQKQWELYQDMWYCASMHSLSINVIKNAYLILLNIMIEQVSFNVYVFKFHILFYKM